MLPQMASGILLSVVVADSGPEPPTYFIDAHVISAGSPVQSKNSCFHLNATIGEPIAGHSYSSDFTLNAGFPQSTSVDDTDAIFFTSFEDCIP